MAKRRARRPKRRSPRRRSSRNHKDLVIVPIVLIIGLLVFSSSAPLTGQVTKSYSNLDNFAVCLTNLGLVVYGRYDDPQLRAMQNDFGESWRFVAYVEGHPLHINYQKELWDRSGVESSPTVLFNGKKFLGYKSIDELSKITTCLPA